MLSNYRDVTNMEFKKNIIAVMALAVVGTAFSLGNFNYNNAFAEGESVGADADTASKGEMLLDEADGGAVFNGVSEDFEGDLIIPDTFNGLPVTEIAENALSGNSKITAVSIPASVKAIGKNAFKGCSGISSVSIMNLINYDIHGIFAECPNIENVVFSLDNAEGFMHDWRNILFGSGTPVNSNYYQCSDTAFVPASLTSVTLYDVALIPDGMFAGMKSLKRVNINGNPSTIGNYAFDGCSSLEFAAAPVFETVTSIGSYAFRGCNSINFGQLRIPNTIKYLGNGAFDSCNTITAVDIPNLINYDINGVFTNCPNIESVEFSLDNCTSFMHDWRTILFDSEMPSDDKYTQCSENIFVPSALKTVSIHDAAVIPDFMFAGMAELKTINIDGKPKSIGESAFDGCSSLEFAVSPISENIETIGSYAFRGCNSINFGQLRIPASVIYIGIGAFDSCNTISAVDIPNLINYDINGIFSNCPNIESVSFSIDNCTSFMHDWRNVLFGTVMPQNNKYTKCSEKTFVPAVLKNVDVYDVTTIPDYMFAGMTNLKTVNIEGGMTSIGESAFDGCSSLEFENSPINESVKSIGSYAFRSCNSINFGIIHIPSSVSYIGTRAFDSCETITGVKIPNLINYDINGIFSNCPNIESVDFSIDNCTGFMHDWRNVLFGTVMPKNNKYTQCGENIFVPTALTTINVHDVADIPAGMFAGMTKVKTINLSGVISSIGSYAFDGCSSLEYPSFLIPESVKAIGECAYRGCKSINFGELDIPFSVSYIGSLAFADCDKITSLSIPRLSQYEVYGIISDCHNIETIEFSVHNSQTDLHSDWKTILFAHDDNFESFNADECVPESLNTINIYDTDCIPDNMFKGLSNIKTINVSGTVTQIGNSAFEGCSSLEYPSFRIPESVETIGECAYKGCKSINFNQLTIPESVKSIGSQAFADCDMLYSVKAPKLVEYQNYGIFLNCNNLSEVEFSIENCNDHLPLSLSEVLFSSPVFDEADGKKQLISETVNIPKAFQTAVISDGDTLGSNLFKKFDAPVNIVVPDSLIAFYDDAFNECKGAVLICKEGSPAEGFAKEHGIKTSDMATPHNVTPDYVHGDVNGDGKIDAMDASITLYNYALASTGHDYELNSEQLTAADANNDGKVDAVDASAILTYYAYSSANGKSSFDEFMNENK